MRIAYVRVSSVDQNEERQIEALKPLNIDKWFIEKISGKNRERPKLQELLDFIREEDELYIKDFSRLARSTKDLLDIIEELSQKKIRLISLNENLDTSTPTGKLMLTVISAINEFERTNLLERQKEGILLAKKRGVYAGRKKIELPQNWEMVINQYMTRQLSGKEAYEKLGLKKSTFYRKLSEYKKTQNKIE